MNPKIKRIISYALIILGAVLIIAYLPIWVLMITLGVIFIAVGINYYYYGK
ncbi:MAG: hypothetical protein N2594_07890 [Clostridiales bacterium]|nr:hypothetical protein [Clostridiales bacterium]